MSRLPVALCVAALLSHGCDHSPDVVASLSTQASEPPPKHTGGASGSNGPAAGTGGPLAGAAAPIAGTGAPSGAPPAEAAGSGASQAGSPSDPCDRLWPELTYLTLLRASKDECRFEITQLESFADFFKLIPTGPPPGETMGPNECNQAMVQTPWYPEDEDTGRLCEYWCRLLSTLVDLETDTRLMCAERGN